MRKTEQETREKIEKETIGKTKKEKIRKIIKETKGMTASISVYLALMLAVMLALIMTLLEGIRRQTIRFETELVMDTGMKSIFAEYNREMLKQYGLFLLDTSYGTVQADSEYTQSHLIRYMNSNFNPPGAKSLGNYKALTGIHADNVQFLETSFGSDQQGEVLRYQIIKYMKESYGTDIICKAVPESADADAYRNLEDRRNSNQNRMEELVENINIEKRAENEEEISLDNPTEAVDSIRGTPWLTQVYGNSKNISKQALPKNLVSNRAIEEGWGLQSSQEKPDGMLSQAIILEYLFERCGRWNDEKESALMKYQLEYLLSGKESDHSNLDEMAGKLFQTRYAINMTHLFSCGSHQAQAQELALVITTAAAQPELAEAVKIAILFAWGYAESIQDVRILMDGNNIEAVKTEAFWNIELSELLTFHGAKDSYQKPSHGVGYEHYLKLFLFLSFKDKSVMRLMDLMEMDIRRTPGNSCFRFDKCIYQTKAQVNVSSKSGYGCRIERFYSYE